MAAAESTALTHYDPTTEERKALIKRTAMAPQATDDEFKLFLAVAERLGLDPLVRQIYAIHRKNGTNADGSDRYQMTIQTGIDGYRAIAEDTGDYAGSDDAAFSTEYGADHPTIASVTVWRFVHGQRCAFTASARWSEYAQKMTDRRTGEIKYTGKWADMPYNQLAKCAEALALRKGFPKQLSGVYTDDEMGQADNPPPAPARAQQPQTIEERYEAERPQRARVVKQADASNDAVEASPLFVKLRARMKQVGVVSMGDANRLCQGACDKTWEQARTMEDYERIEEAVAKLERKQRDMDAIMSPEGLADADSEQVASR